jgi:hypothetical protein
VVKIGLELFTAVGPDAIGTMMDQAKVFVDLKLTTSPTPSSGRQGHGRWAPAT